VRFSVQLATDNVSLPEEFLTAEAIAEQARAAEAAGFDAVFVTDHPIPGERWLRAGGHHTLDPFVALAFAAAATRRIRLQTHVLVLPYRNPFLVAKAAATLDVASGGRLILGVAAGYLESEFAALGVPFAERNERFDEALAVLKRAWSEQGVALEGRGFRAEGNTALPRPVQRPHPPLWVGGNSRRAIRRAVEHGDGWLPFPASARLAGVTRTAVIATPEDLTARIALAREHARAVGRRAPLEIGFVPFGFERGPSGAPDDGARLAEQAEKLAPLGVGWLLLTLPCRTRAEYVERVGRLGDALPRRRGQVPPAIAQE
jgi:probable F420-dependent oxidoreductase